MGCPSGAATVAGTNHEEDVVGSGCFFGGFCRFPVVFGFPWAF